MFSSLFISGNLTLTSFMISIGSALVLGIISAIFYMYKATYTKSFVITLAMIPSIVAIIIMMVSGSLGASVAVAGTFSLVRFRSNPGTAKEIGAVFMSTAIGLACGIGYPVFAAIFTIILCLVEFILETVHFGQSKHMNLQKTLNITVPEDLNYSGIFNDIFKKYTSSYTLIRVKTTNLGSLNRLTYDIVLKKEGLEKAMIDALRVRNGNLEISISIPTMNDSL